MLFMDICCALIQGWKVAVVPKTFHWEAEAALGEAVISLNFQIILGNGFALSEDE